MLTRIITAACLLPLVAVVYFGPPIVFLLLTILAVGLAVRETLSLHEGLHEALAVKGAKPGIKPVAAAALVGSVLVCVSFHDPVHLPLGLALAASLALAFGLRAVLRPSLDNALPDLAATATCILYPGLLLAFLVGVRNLPSAGAETPPGPALLVFLLAIVFGNDAAAYFAGRAFGRLKLAPSISPGKTVEGFLFGLLGGVLLGLVVAHFLPTGLSLPQAIGWGALLALAGVFGDLSKSMLKRSAHVKDSGHLLPGHGGVLDRLDGLLFAAPALYYLASGLASGAVMSAT